MAVAASPWFSFLNTLVWAFGFGMLNALSPCNLATLPLWVAYWLQLAPASRASASVPGATPTQPSASSLASTTSALGFVCGVLAVFVPLGLLCFYLHQAVFGLWQSSPWLPLGMGLLLLTMGLAGLLPTLAWAGGAVESSLAPLLQPLQRWGQRALQRAQQRHHTQGQALHFALPLVLGVAYALVLSPCGTGYMLSLAAWVVHSANLWQAALVLAAFGLGQSGVFLVMNLLYQRVSDSFAKTGVPAHWHRWAGRLQQAGYGLMVAFGLFWLYKAMAG
jgi:cytochrome c biogenesis protein CcdA